MTIFHGLSTTEEIRARFDQDVERFSNLETGQSAAVDAPLALELNSQAAAAVNPKPLKLLDLGCGAGNFTLRLLSQCSSISDVTLVDLSPAMLQRAVERVGQVSSASVRTLEGDLRTVPFDDQRYDVILAAAVLHHLRDEDDWRQTFARLFRATAPGGAVWIFDLVAHGNAAVQNLMWSRYGEYLTSLRDEAYRDQVFAYASREDSPRPLPFQLQLLSESGFADVEVLHCHSGFAAFGAIRANDSASSK